ncbi:MAG: UDP-2,3-diacylglucosamine diphosphatase [Bacteroidota bacterium]
MEEQTTITNENISGKIYFASDCHLGVPDAASSLVREKLFVAWLEEARKDAAEIYLCGDIFDFWFEYKTVIPKGFSRLLGTLSSITDSGIKVHYFTGNHDMWVFRYFTEELGMPVYRKPIVRMINGKKMMIGHGDGLGPGDYGYKFIKKVFANRICQVLFAWLHPRVGVGMALFFSRRSRVARGNTDEVFRGEDGERLLVYTKQLLAKEHFDYFIFGHRHLPLDIKLAENSRYINLGDWISNFTYGVLDGGHFELKRFEKQVVNFL